MQLFRLFLIPVFDELGAEVIDIIANSTGIGSTEVRSYLLLIEGEHNFPFEAEEIILSNDCVESIL